MKTLLKVLVIYIIIGLIIFTLFSISSGNFDITTWDIEQRSSCAITIGISLIFLIMLFPILADLLDE